MIRLWGAGLVVLSALFLAGVSGSAPMDAGDIDTTFGDNGAVLASISTYGAEAHAVVVQPDDKIVLAGWTQPPPPPPLPPLSLTSHRRDPRVRSETWTSSPFA